MLLFCVVGGGVVVGGVSVLAVVVGGGCVVVLLLFVLLLFMICFVFDKLKGDIVRTNFSLIFQTSPCFRKKENSLFPIFKA